MAKIILVKLQFKQINVLMGKHPSINNIFFVVCYHRNRILIFIKFSFLYLSLLSLHQYWGSFILLIWAWSIVDVWPEASIYKYILKARLCLLLFHMINNFWYIKIGINHWQIRVNFSLQLRTMDLWFDLRECATKHAKYRYHDNMT